MDFGLDDDHRALQASLTRLLQRHAPLAQVQAVAAQDEPTDPVLIHALADQGLFALLVPTDCDGLGLGLLEAALAAEALGACAAPAPYLGPVLSGLALTLGGDAALKKRLLPAIATGSLLPGLAISEASSGARRNFGVTASGGRLTGTALAVVDFATANGFVVASRCGGLFWLESDASGLSCNRLTNIDRTRSLGELQCHDTPALALDNGDVGQTLRTVENAARVLVAADTLGAASTMLTRAVAYAQERRQFGREIGSFQAVKHLCAEMASELEAARALVWYAAHAQDTLPDQATLLACHAKAHLSEVGTFVARTATEVFGGIGITDALGLHLQFKRIGLNRQLFGAPERCRVDAARAQGLIGQRPPYPAQAQV